jgi:hypothetical protein
MEQAAESRESLHSLEDLVKAIRAEYDAAEDLAELLGRERVELTKAYEARPLGNEHEGRSSIVMSDVRDTVGAMMPSLMRVFFGTARPVEFVPTSPDPQKIAEAQQATDYVDYVLKNDNPGFLEFYRWFKDALVRRIGVIKVWWDERASVEAFRMPASDEQVVAALAAETAVDPSVEIRPDGADLLVRRVRKASGIRVRCVPPEEFLFSVDAVNIDDARYVAHRTYLPVSDVISMGYPAEVVEEAASPHADTITQFGEERIQRYVDVYLAQPNRDDVAGRMVLFVEHYIRYDGDGDGVAELHRVVTVGDRFEVLADDVVQEHPFVVITPDPEPHQLVGVSVAERVIDLQKTRTMLMRGLLDSLALSVMPRMGVVEGHASLADVLNTEIGAPIRMDAPGMVMPMTVPFAGRDALPVLQYIDELRENRTGVSKAAVGLSPDSLQSATKVAVEATVRGAKEHIELIARVFAESGVAPLYRKAYHLLVHNQDTIRVVRLRGQWVQVSPLTWSADLHAVVRVGVGESANEERIQLLQGLTEKLEWVFQTMGPSNMLVRPSNYRNLIAKILELSGIYDVNAFVRPVDPRQEEQALQAMGQPKPDPQQETAKMLADVQVEQIKADIAMKQAELQLREREMALKHEREMAQLRQEYELKLAELQLRYGGTKNDQLV